MAEKRKKVLLTLKQKLELLEKFENGEFVKKLANDYGIGVQTVRDIKKNKEKLIELTRNCSSEAGPAKRKYMKKSTYENLDAALLQWFQQSGQKGYQFRVLCVLKKLNFSIGP